MDEEPIIETPPATGTGVFKNVNGLQIEMTPEEVCILQAQQASAVRQAKPLKDRLLEKFAFAMQNYAPLLTDQELHTVMALATSIDTGWHTSASILGHDQHKRQLKASILSIPAKSRDFVALQTALIQTIEEE